MGEYAEMAMERDWESQFHSDEYDYLDNVVIRSSKKVESGLPFKEWEVGTHLLMRQFLSDLDTLKLNAVCIVQKYTEKAVLFKIDRDFETELTKNITFWLPKSVLYRKENEIKVVYVKHWATIKGVEELFLV